MANLKTALKNKEMENKIIKKQKINKSWKR